MSIKNYSIRIALPVIIMAVVAVSCSRDDDPFGDNLFLLSAEKAFTMPAISIQNIIGIIAGTQPEISAIADLVEHDVEVYTITYTSYLYGEKIKASGLVCLPATPGNYPVLSFQNGTNTLHSKAPSVNPSDFSYQLIEDVASMGFIVLIPDYPGFGSSSDKAHPYLLKEPTVATVVDMLSALREFDDDIALVANATDDLYLFGYSQGGWATLALHREVEENSPAGFNLVASAAGAGPADLKGMLSDFISAEEYPMPSYFAYIAHSYKTYNQFSVGYDAIFNNPYAALIPTLFNGTLSTTAINGELTTDVSVLLTEGFRSGFLTGQEYATVRQSLEDNSITAWKTMTPLLLVHGEEDTQVPASGTVSLYDGMIAAGSSQAVVNLQLIPGVDHGDGLIPAAVGSLIFLFQFAGIL